MQDQPSNRSLKYGENAAYLQAMQDQGTGSTLKRGSTSAAYLQARLRRDAPEVAVALERGEFKSAKAAAKAFSY